MPRNSLPQALIIEPINLSNLQWETRGHNKRKQLNANQYYNKTHERLASQKSFNQKLHYTLQIYMGKRTEPQNESPNYNKTIAQ
jgi:hypothetical protein